MPTVRPVTVLLTDSLSREATSAPSLKPDKVPAWEIPAVHWFRAEQSLEPFLGALPALKDSQMFMLELAVSVLGSWLTLHSPKWFFLAIWSLFKPDFDWKREKN